MRRRVVLVAAALAGVAALVGCSEHPLIPAAATTHTKPAMAAPRRPPLLGVDVYSEENYPGALVSSYGSVALRYIQRRLDAQVVGLMWDLCSPAMTSDVVQACATDRRTNTGPMSASDIATLAKIARSDGLQIAMRPIIRVGPPSGWNTPFRSWEGRIHPANEQLWFENLLKAETPYLRVAKAVGVVQFVVGTELTSLRYSPFWIWFLNKAHDTCNCQVSYAAQDAQYLSSAPNLPPTNAMGTDWYPRLPLNASASQAAVTAAWEASLAKVPASKLERTSMDEIGIRATVGAYRHPYAWNVGGKNDATVQVRYFTAACATAAKYHMQALYFYFMPLNDNPASPISFPAYFVRNAGSKAIAGCRKILAG